MTIGAPRLPEGHPGRLWKVSRRATIRITTRNAPRQAQAHAAITTRRVARVGIAPIKTAPKLFGKFSRKSFDKRVNQATLTAELLTFISTNAKRGGGDR